MLEARHQEAAQALVDRPRPRGYLAQRVDELVALALDHGIVDFLFIFEVSVYGAAPLLGSLGDIAHGGVCHALVCKQLACHLYQFLAGFQYHSTQRYEFSGGCR